jgi:uncharacterized BrkB/YihY/UPF0761 family membrane protein
LMPTYFLLLSVFPFALVVPSLKALVVTIVDVSIKKCNRTHICHG